MNTHTLSEYNNHNSIYSTNKSDESFPNVSEVENTGLQDGVDFDVILPASTLRLYENMSLPID